jgi:hypothetical protein
MSHYEYDYSLSTWANESARDAHDREQGIGDYAPPVAETPPVKTTALRAYPGWVVCHRPDNGMYWARDTRGVGIGPGETTFADAVFFAKHGRPPIGDELAK